KLDDDTFVKHIAYNAKGQRTLIAYGNRIFTAYEYDETTFRLARMWTSAFIQPGGVETDYQSDGPPLQNFGYAYDLAGNVRSITEVTPGCGVRGNPDADAARFQNLSADLRTGDALVREFEYDALYRLIRATGREANNIAAPPPWPDDFQIEGFNWGTPAVPTPGNAARLTAKYVETYSYDPAGNMMKLSHNGAGLPWTRNYGMSGFTPEEWRDNVQDFMTGGTPDWGNGGNRLTNFGAASNAVTHQFDSNGNMTREFSNRVFDWDHSDRLRSFRELDGAGNPSKAARYLYDSSGQRVMKRVWIDGRVEVTIYVDGLFEHRFSGTEANNTIHVMDNQSRIAMVRVGDPLGGD